MPQCIYETTLQIFSSETSMFLAAKSLWTNDLLSRYRIPVAMCWQNLSSMCLSAASEAMTWSLSYCDGVMQLILVINIATNSWLLAQIFPYVCFCLSKKLLKSPLERSSRTIIVCKR